MERRNFIYIADDNQILRDVLFEAIGNYFPNYQIRTFPNGKELADAISLFPKRVALVLTDNDMPYQTGLQVVEEYSRSHPAIPFVIMSGNNVKEEAMKAGAHSFLEKPFNLPGLKTLLEQYI